MTESQAWSARLIKSVIHNSWAASCKLVAVAPLNVGGWRGRPGARFTVNLPCMQGKLEVAGAVVQSPAGYRAVMAKKTNKTNKQKSQVAISRELIRVWCGAGSHV